MLSGQPHFFFHWSVYSPKQKMVESGWVHKSIQKSHDMWNVISQQELPKNDIGLICPVPGVQGDSAGDILKH